MNGPDPERPLVLKFGGSCFLDLDDFRMVADFVAGRLAESSRLIVVVSAMSGTTGNLQKALRTLHGTPPPQLTAQLLTTGDTVSAVLLAAALCHIGVEARAVEAHEEGMSAAGSPERAHLVTIDPAPLWGALSSCRVVVMPGGQAIDTTRRTVTLGRNSSDLSAVAAAIAVGSATCEIFSDVPGVFTADPYLLHEARVIGELGYGTAKRMSRAGAKVVHLRAIELAERHGLRIVCRTRPPDGTLGTVISAVGSPAAVIADTRSAAWAFPDVGAMDRAVERLADERLNDQGLDLVVVDYEGKRHLVVPGGDQHDVAKRACAAALPRPDLRLLTTIRGEYEPERLLVPEEELIPEARRRHDMHYPPQESRPDTKPRSPLSSLLTTNGAGNAPLLVNPAPENRADGTETV